MKLASPKALNSSPPTGPRDTDDEREYDRQELLANIDSLRKYVSEACRNLDKWSLALTQAQDALDDFDMEQSIAKERSLDNALEARLDREDA